MQQSRPGVILDHPVPQEKPSPTLEASPPNYLLGLYSFSPSDLCHTHHRLCLSPVQQGPGGTLNLSRARVRAYTRRLGTSGLALAICKAFHAHHNLQLFDLACLTFVGPLGTTCSPRQAVMPHRPGLSVCIPGSGPTLDNHTPPLTTNAIDSGRPHLSNTTDLLFVFWNVAAIEKVTPHTSSDIRHFYSLCT